jgi:hypothetical protein
MLIKQHMELMLINANLVHLMQIKNFAPTKFAMHKVGLIAKHAIMLLKLLAAGMILTLLINANIKEKVALHQFAKIINHLTKLPQDHIKMKRKALKHITGPNNALSLNIKT